MAFKQKASGIPFESHVFYSSIRSGAHACLCFFKGAACQSDGANLYGQQPGYVKTNV
ncbi:hypothetical protein [Bacillus atrophaeus]|uniref:hypothetical protein n=1 Tax=Bacillus atrophaeus TaxID=1452 RepID=UPI0037C1693E